MSPEELITAAYKEGFEKGTMIIVIHKTINMLRRFKCSDKKIFELLKPEYGDSFSDKQLKNFLKQN